LTAWGWKNLTQSRGLERLFQKFAVKRCDAITCDAQHMIDALIKLGAERRKIKFVNFGVDTRTYCPRPKNINLERSLGSKDRYVVFSNRALEPVYDVQTLIRSMPLVVNKIPNVRFVIAGHGSLKRFLTQLASKIEMMQYVIFTGFIPHDEIVEYLNLTDVFVSTSLSDGGLSESVAEAMACELPVIVTDFGDNAKWVQDGENGYIFPKGDAEALATKILKAITDNKQGFMIGKQARQTIIDNKNINVAMNKAEQIYNDFTNRRR
jgi:glycosyltransferase involved in cell wall biosynthesis